MNISLAHSRASGFKKWSDNHQPSDDDDQPADATPVAIAVLPAADSKQPHRPWHIPGTGTSL
jgi:hypothetical protein